jgi:hypothetical protein
LIKKIYHPTTSFQQITLQVNNIGHIVLRDFKGLEKCDESTRKMVLNFSLNLAQGMLDQAFRYDKDKFNIL